MRSPVLLPVFVLGLVAACDESSTSGTPDDTAAGCDDTVLLASPADPGARGPWPVGARTVSIDGFLFDCDPAHVSGPEGWAIVNYATTAVLEETLQCRPADGLAAHERSAPGVAEYAEEL